uniref:Uncharacterized protein n=1 Tax=Lepeophtheirus salmonis TaxID=72036 RepID=A0A0K2TF12_LEPSM
MISCIVKCFSMKLLSSAGIVNLRSTLHLSSSQKYAD